jgi:hypothetical protein
MWPFTPFTLAFAPFNKPLLLAAMTKAGQLQADDAH